MLYQSVLTFSIHFFTFRLRFFLSNGDFASSRLLSFFFRLKGELISFFSIFLIIVYPWLTPAPFQGASNVCSFRCILSKSEFTPSITFRCSSILVLMMSEARRAAPSSCSTLILLLSRPDVRLSRIRNSISTGFISNYEL